MIYDPRRGQVSLFEPTAAQRKELRIIKIGEEEAASLLEELRELVDTLGIPVSESILVNVKESNRKYLTGSGKCTGSVACTRTHVRPSISTEATCGSSHKLISNSSLSPSSRRTTKHARAPSRSAATCSGNSIGTASPATTAGGSSRSHWLRANAASACSRSADESAATPRARRIDCLASTDVVW